MGKEITENKTDSRLGSTPGSGLGSAPDSRLGSTPGSGLGSAPDSRLGSTPGSRLGSAPAETVFQEDAEVEMRLCRPPGADACRRMWESLSDEEMAYEFWLAGIPYVPARKKCMLRQKAGTAKAVHRLKEKQLSAMGILTKTEAGRVRAAQKDAAFSSAYEKMKKANIAFVPFFAPQYPPRLLQIPDFPFALFVKGNLPSPDARAAAIVGARVCSAYGEKYALEFGQTLAAHGVEIISGLAAGIDGLSQRGALKGKGKTFGVLGCGVDICYPRENFGLYMDILENGGGILSEFAPGTRPLPANFPMRNRVISGLSDAVLVIEARMKSGSLITADMALEQGRDVYALPGPADSALSFGCNSLLMQGAGVLLSAGELLKEWGISEPAEEKEKGVPKKRPAPDSLEERVYRSVGRYPRSINQLAKETNLTISVLMQALVSLQLQGMVREVSKNSYVRAS